jgi:hypothetical protein
VTLVYDERTKPTSGSRAVNAAPSLDEVVRLGALLAERVVASEGTVSADQAVALAKAARLLQDHDVEWPPILAQAIHKLAEEEPAPASSGGIVVALSSVVTKSSRTL